jgi:endonuclease
MAIYDRPVRLLMREMIDELAPDAASVFTRRDALNWLAERYPKD